jgi:hypothetical protein
MCILTGLHHLICRIIAYHHAMFKLCLWCQGCCCQSSTSTCFICLHFCRVMTFSIQNITIWSNFFWCSGSFSYGYKLFPRDKQTSPENPSLALLPQIVRHKGTLYCGGCLHDIMLLNSVGRVPWPCFSIDEYHSFTVFFFTCGT